MDNMIKQAAEQHHPSYDNKAWDKMEQLLDKHLPQRRDRRGFIFFLLLGGLLIGGLFVGGYYFLTNKKETVAKVETEKGADRPVAATSVLPNSSSTTDPNASSSANVDDNSKLTSGPASNQNSNTTNIPGQDQNNKTANGSEQLQANAFTIKRSAGKTKVNISPAYAVEDDVTATKGSPATKKAQQDKGSFSSEIAKINTANADKKNTATELKTDAVENKTEAQQTAKKPVDTEISKEVAKDKSIETVNKKTTASNDKKRSKNSIAGNFGLSFSAGPDISWVELKKPGKVTLAYGVGLSYTFIKKLTLQTGFYVSRKIYSADSADYHAPDGFWTAYPGMDNTVAADCKVYEVPVNLLYNFKQKGKHNWYAGAGLSTYFMKHEGYDYSYSISGMVFPKSISLDNENQHNFSVVTLTGGYKYNLSPRLSLSAEPFVKLPVNGGVGFGRVQLKGAGVLFNVTLKPFAKGKH